MSTQEAVTAVPRRPAEPSVPRVPASPAPKRVRILGLVEVHCDCGRFLGRLSYGATLETACRGCRDIVIIVVPPPSRPMP